MAIAAVQLAPTNISLLRSEPVLRPALLQTLHSYGVSDPDHWFPKIFRSFEVINLRHAHNR